jgi:hypothetical protein
MSCYFFLFIIKGGFLSEFMQKESNGTSKITFEEHFTALYGALICAIGNL